ncbi:MAG: hypothetical protein ABL995_00370 [Bryobacteraceae bacterium]
MRSLFVVMLAAFIAPVALLAQFGGRDGDVVIYSVSAKGNADLVAVPAGTTNTVSGFQVKDPNALTPSPFGSDFAGEFFVNLHNETGDNFRYIIQKEGIVTQHNLFQGPGKVMISQGLDRLLIPNKDPIDLTAGLYAPFPQGVDFGPELPIVEARSFLWTPSPTFPLITPAPDTYKGPQVPANETGSEYVLELGQFLGILRWQGLNSFYPGAGWKQGIDVKVIEQDNALGSVSRVFRLRGGRTTPTFLVRANTHLAVLSGSVTITPAGGTPFVLTKHQYAFVPSGFAITLSNPKVYSGPTFDAPVSASLTVDDSTADSEAQDAAAADSAPVQDQAPAPADSTSDSGAVSSDGVQ